VVALSDVTYKGKIFRGSKHNIVNYVWRLELKLFSSLRIKIQGNYLVGILKGLYDRGIVVRFLSTARDFTSKPALRLWAPPNILYKKYQLIFPWGLHIFTAFESALTSTACYAASANPWTETI